MINVLRKYGGYKYMGGNYMSVGDTTDDDFFCEQSSLYDQSRTCKYCFKIVQCTDVTSPTQIHPFCRVKEQHLTTEPIFDPEDFF